MKQAEMRAIVDAELEHIPGFPGEHQGLLRAAYNMARMHSLGKRATKKQTASDVLQDCIEALKKENPDARFYYDKDFFERNTHDSC